MAENTAPPAATPAAPQSSAPQAPAVAPTPAPAASAQLPLYRNVSQTHHTLAPDGRPFPPGAEDRLSPVDVARLIKWKPPHIWKVPEPPSGGAK